MTTEELKEKINKFIDLKIKLQPLYNGGDIGYGEPRKPEEQKLKDTILKKLPEGWHFTYFGLIKVEGGNVVAVVNIYASVDVHTSEDHYKKEIKEELKPCILEIFTLRKFHDENFCETTKIEAKEYLNLFTEINDELSYSGSDAHEKLYHLWHYILIRNLEDKKLEDAKEKLKGIKDE